MLTKVYGQAEANRLLKIEFDAIAQRRSEVFNYQADQSTNPKSVDPPASFLTLQRNELIPEMNGQLQDQKKSGDPSDFHAAAYTLTGQGCQASLTLICGRIGEWQEDGYEGRKTALKRSSIPGLSWIRAHKTRTKMICLLRVW